jgi:hypothetical protein
MSRKIIYIIVVLLALSSETFAQIDLRVKGFSFTRCDTTGLTTIYLWIQNAMPVALPFGTVFDASYRINEEPPVTETFTLPYYDKCI